MAEGVNGDNDFVSCFDIDLDFETDFGFEIVLDFEMDFGFEIVLDFEMDFGFDIDFDFDGVGVRFIVVFFCFLLTGRFLHFFVVVLNEQFGSDSQNDPSVIDLQTG